MKKFILTLVLGTAVFLPVSATIRVNQVGYLPSDIKVAVYFGENSPENLTFELSDSNSNSLPVDSVVSYGPLGMEQNACRIYFSSLSSTGNYTLSLVDEKGDKIEKADFYIGNDAYSRLNLNELPLVYLRQQRCGYNPAHLAECHLNDGIVVLSDSLEGQHFDVTGGWHDASDYLQYLPTSANTVYQMLFAYREFPDVWADEFDARGDMGSNGVPDILDEARWGLEWMMKMNPRDGIYFNQIADDRDHRYSGVPQNDSVDYDFGPGGSRPVYPVSGKPYGLREYKNRSTGEASSVGKFASAFAIGSEVFSDIEPDFSAELAVRSRKALDHALSHPGASQTACCVSPYFYEEDNWVDDVELAAAALYRLQGNVSDLETARKMALREEVTPWMGADTARHYQWYPFINLGHFEASEDGKLTEFSELYRKGLQRVADRGSDNVYLFGVPFVWCSNNLTVALVTQAMLYRQMSGDDSFLELETAARDWLFGVNPWGQTMIIMPEGAVESSPLDSHSAMSNIEVQGRPGRDFLIGGLVDGPVYATIFNSLRGVHLRHDDRFSPYQSKRVVYHDDYSDYSTNEPTMDGTASLTYMLGRLCK